VLTFASLRKHAGTITLAGLVALLALALFEIVLNHRAFNVTDTSFAQGDPSAEWTQPAYGASEFRPIDLPFFLSAGNFRINFETNVSGPLDLSVYAVDCLLEAHLDGQPVYKRTQRCQSCSIWHAWSSRRCRADVVTLPLTPGRHVLAVKTQNNKSSESNQQRDVKLLFVHYQNAAFAWRVLALACVAGLIWLLVSYVRTRDWLSLPVAHARAVVRHRALALILVFSLLPKLVIAPSFLTTDVSQSALIYTENLVNKKDWHVAKLDKDYEAAKYWGKSYMHKAPGVYYQYAIPRLLFGFNEAYFLGLARLPGMLGDILIAWVIWAMVRTRQGDWQGTLAAGVYLLSTGVFFTTGYVGRIDSLAIGFLMLALWQSQKHPPGNIWFSIFLGAAVAWKQLALLIVPLLLSELKRFKWLVLAGAVTLLLCSPYLLDDPKLFLERLTMPQLTKETGGVSWMINLSQWGIKDEQGVSRIVTLGYMAALCVLPWFVRLDVWRSGALAFGLFVAATKNVYEHYIMWSMPFMIVLAFTGRSIVALIAFALGTLTMTLRTERMIFLESDIAYDWSVLLGATFFATCVTLIATSHGFSDSVVVNLLRRLKAARRSRPSREPQEPARPRIEPAPAEPKESQGSI
jgi:hypothetical protein